MPTSPISERAVASLRWSMLMEVVRWGITPAIYIILARLLTPEDFGIMSIALIAINFSRIFWEAGLGRSLVQIENETEDAADVVFWLNVALSGLVYALLFVAAPWIAAFLNSPDAYPVLRVLGLQVLIGAFGAVQQALFVRELQFRHLFWIRLLTSALPGIVSIPMALGGSGVWALVAGSLAGSLLNLVLLWRRSPWRPRARFKPRLMWALAGFGGWVVAENLAAWFFLWGDNLIVGRFLGVEELGVYAVGWQITTLVFGLLLNPFLPVLYPTFCRLQGSPEALRALFFKVSRVMAALAIPLGVTLLVTGEDIASVLFGDQWADLGYVIALIGFMHGITWLVGASPELYRAIGRPDLNAKLMIVTIGYYLPVYLIAAPYGLRVFTAARVGAALLAIPAHLFLLNRVMGISLRQVWAELRTIFLAGAAMGAALLLLAEVWPAGAAEWLRLVVFGVSGAGVFFIVLLLADRAFVGQTAQLIRRAANFRPVPDAS